MIHNRLAFLLAAVLGVLFLGSAAEAAWIIAGVLWIGAFGTPYVLANTDLGKHILTDANLGNCNLASRNLADSKRYGDS